MGILTELSAIEERLQSLRQQENSDLGEIHDLETKRERLKNLSMFYKLHYL